MACNHNSMQMVFVARMAFTLVAAFFAVGTPISYATPQASSQSKQETDLEFFESQIRPLLIAHCYSCHSESAASIKGGLRLDTREGTRVGGDSGPAVVPGDTAKSLLLSAVRYDGLEMPPDGKLSDAQIHLLERWIRMGAPDPRDGTATASSDRVLPAKALEFWSLRPIRPQRVPDVNDPEWPRTPLDPFVQSKREAAGMLPAGEADRLDWLRRVFYDLTGLPPSLEEIDSFLHDEAPDAYERIVDQLLASPDMENAGHSIGWTLYASQKPRASSTTERFPTRGASGTTSSRR